MAKQSVQLALEDKLAELKEEADTHNSSLDRARLKGRLLDDKPSGSEL